MYGYTSSEIFLIILSLFLIFYFVFINPYFIHKEKVKKYENTDYFKSTKIPYKTNLNTGEQGEYYLYKELESLVPEGARFLFNVYIPTKDGYTEIDCILLYKSGIFVFESKNYSGWIFGNDSCNNWHQSLFSPYVGVEKFAFFNPVLQNKHHIFSLKDFLGERVSSKINFYSVITFSDRCKFKDIVINSKDVKVIHRCDVMKVVDVFSMNNMDNLNDTQIEWLYNKLYPQTQLSDEIKQKHINNVSNFN